MATKKLNPFPLTGYQGPEFFCNRDKELQTITNALQNQRNTLLISLRRIGKTALIKHAYHHLSSRKVITIYCDLQATTSQHDMINALATAIWQAAPEHTSWGKRMIEYIKSFRPVISFNELTGKPEVTIAHVKSTYDSHTLGQMLQYFDTLDKPVFVTLDEFQQITQYPETTTEAFLRSIIQHLKFTSFIFSGSQQHVLAEMFSSPKRPFFTMAQVLKLHKLDREEYRDFIRSHFETAGKNPDGQALDFILDWTYGHTYYTQALCNRLFSSSGTGKLTIDDARTVAAEIIAEHQPVFFSYRNILTEHQWRFLKAIAHEAPLYGPTGGAFLSRYKLGGSSTAKRSLEALLAKEMIFKEIDADGEAWYGVYNAFLARWFQQLNGVQ